MHPKWVISINVLCSHFVEPLAWQMESMLLLSDPLYRIELFSLSFSFSLALLLLVFSRIFSVDFRSIGVQFFNFMICRGFWDRREQCTITPSHSNSSRIYSVHFHKIFLFCFHYCFMCFVAHVLVRCMPSMCPCTAICVVFEFMSGQTNATMWILALDAAAQTTRVHLFLIQIYVSRLTTRRPMLSCDAYLF